MGTGYLLGKEKDTGTNIGNFPEKQYGGLLSISKLHSEHFLAGLGLVSL